MSKHIIGYVIVGNDYLHPVQCLLKRLPNGDYRSADASAMCFPARKVKTWDELTEEQKRNCQFSAVIESIEGGL